jgi:DNA-binding transcriptional LysR family regulator
MYEGPEFRHLRFFIAVAEELNIGKAAAKLNATQPNVSRAIQQLEDGLQSRLFKRGRAGTGLTERGLAFLPFARQMVDMRAESIRATSTVQAPRNHPLRFGYSPFTDHQLVTDAMQGFCQLVPDGSIDPSSECSGQLVPMILGGSLEAALVTLPIPREHLYIHDICSERVLVCLRRDDPLAGHEELPREAIIHRLRILFSRLHQPMFYDYLLHKFEKASMDIRPAAFVSSPQEMQFLVANKKGLGLIRESAPLLPELVTRPIERLKLKVTTALICLAEQKRPVLPMLAFNLAEQCLEEKEMAGRKKPNGRVISPMETRRRDAA